MTAPFKPSHWPLHLLLVTDGHDAERLQLVEASIAEPEEFATYQTPGGHGWLVRRRSQRSQMTSADVRAEGQDAEWYQIWLHLWTPDGTTSRANTLSRAVGLSQELGKPGRWGRSESGIEMGCTRCAAVWVIYPPVSRMGLQVLAEAGAGGTMDPCPVCDASLWETAQRVRAQHRRHMECDALFVMEPEGWARHYVALAVHLQGVEMLRSTPYCLGTVQQLVDERMHRPTGGRGAADMPPDETGWGAWWHRFWSEVTADVTRRVFA